MNLLIVDDEVSFRQHLGQLFRRRGHTVKSASSGEEALDLSRQEIFDLVLLDIMLPDLDGIEILQILKQNYHDIQVIMMTGNATIENAIASMKLGAYDYLIKPFDLEELMILVERAGELSRLRRESAIFQRELDIRRQYDEFVGKSKQTRQVLELVEKVAPANSTVMITGETGTGKDLIAKIIHRKSNRRDKPFVIVNCSAIQDTLLESEMFGHEKGAFTGALKSKRGLVDVSGSGTLFLDEIGDVSPGFQTKLLRFLESGEYRPVGSTRSLKSRVRIIAATNRDLKNLLEKGLFREDLYYRLNVFNIHIPPLRERLEDIEVLVNACLRKICLRTGKCIKQVSEEAIRHLRSYHWPGNVRELENVIERATILCNGKTITPADLPVDLKVNPITKSETAANTLAAQEKRHIQQILEESNWNKTQAARVLGISKKTLYHKIRLYKLSE